MVLLKNLTLDVINEWHKSNRSHQGHIIFNDVEEGPEVCGVVLDTKPDDADLYHLTFKCYDMYPSKELANIALTEDENGNLVYNQMVSPFPCKEPTSFDEAFHSILDGISTMAERKYWYAIEHEHHHGCDETFHSHNISSEFEYGWCSSDFADADTVREVKRIYTIATERENNPLALEPIVFFDKNHTPVCEADYSDETEVIDVKRNDDNMVIEVTLGKIGSHPIKLLKDLTFRDIQNWAKNSCSNDNSHWNHPWISGHTIDTAMDKKTIIEVALYEEVDKENCPELEDGTHPDYTLTFFAYDDQIAWIYLKQDGDKLIYCGYSPVINNAKGKPTKFPSFDKCFKAILEEHYMKETVPVLKAAIEGEYIVSSNGGQCPDYSYLKEQQPIQVKSEQEQNTKPEENSEPSASIVHLIRDITAKDILSWAQNPNNDEWVYPAINGRTIWNEEEHLTLVGIVLRATPDRTDNITHTLTFELRLEPVCEIYLAISNDEIKVVKWSSVYKPFTKPNEIVINNADDKTSFDTLYSNLLSEVATLDEECRDAIKNEEFTDNPCFGRIETEIEEPDDTSNENTTFNTNEVVDSNSVEVPTDIDKSSAPTESDDTSTVETESVAEPTEEPTLEPNNEPIYDEEFMRQPLAIRMRPTKIEEVVGQSKLTQKNSLLWRMANNNVLSSIILFGPPGSGKTSIANVIAECTNAEFIQLNAVASGKADLEKSIKTAEANLKTGKRTILFIDEIHRYDKRQQDYLLPYVEKGVVILIGATTENPSFEVNPALVSRSTIFRLEPITVDDIIKVIDNALTSPKGLKHLGITIDEPVKQLIAEQSNGDVRHALSLLEVACLTSSQGHTVTIDAVKEIIQKPHLQYDTKGNYHYDTISAFIKSLRGSDADAALYYLAIMIEAGEEPEFIARRIMVSASEDVGNADPYAMTVALNASLISERIGFPEARITLAQAVEYIAMAPKSNSAVVGIDNALEYVRNNPNSDIPMHLRDAHYKTASRYGFGQGYLYPHDFPYHWVSQEYLPADVPKRAFYKNSHIGYEAVQADYQNGIRRFKNP